jgi:hypothetical protein
LFIEAKIANDAVAVRLGSNTASHQVDVRLPIADICQLVLTPPNLLHDPKYQRNHTTNARNTYIQLPGPP